MALSCIHMFVGGNIWVCKNPQMMVRIDGDRVLQKHMSSGRINLPIDYEGSA